MKNKHWLSEEAFERNKKMFEDNGHIFRETEKGYEFVPTENKVRESIAMREALGRDLQRRMNQ